MSTFGSDAGMDEVEVEDFPPLPAAAPASRGGSSTGGGRGRAPDPFGAGDDDPPPPAAATARAGRRAGGAATAPADEPPTFRPSAPPSVAGRRSAAPPSPQPRGTGSGASSPPPFGGPGPTSRESRPSSSRPGGASAGPPPPPRRAAAVAKSQLHPEDVRQGLRNPYDMHYDGDAARTGAIDPRQGGGGGLSGLRDPYDRPTRSQLSAAQSRLRQDKASGALYEVAGRYRVLFGGHHVVRKGLRRSIGDAYAAYVGQVINLPQDTYGLALRALDANYNPGGNRQPGFADVRLHTSPYATSRAKHAQIFNAAKKIMRDLEAYVYDVSYYCPGELDQLRGMRRPGNGRAEGVEGYAEEPRLEAQEPPRHREAVQVTRRAGAPRPPPPAGFNPIAGTMHVEHSTAQHAGAQHSTAQHGRAQHGAAQHGGAGRGHSRPRTAPSAGGGGGGRGGRDAESDEAAAAAAAAARSVAAAMGSAAEAEAREGEAGWGPERAAQHEEWQAMGLRRLSSPGMHTKTPPHYRVSKFYQHVSPTEEVLDFMRKRAAKRAQQQVAAAAAGGEGAEAAEAAAAESAAAAAEAISKIEKVLKHSHRYHPKPPPGAFDPSAARTSPPRHASPGRGQAQGAAYPPVWPVGPTTPGRAYSPASGAGAPDGVRVAEGETGEDPSTARIMWIIETAYELGLAQALGLEGPWRYPRSHRKSPSPYRRRHYDSLYSSPERYGPAIPDMPLYGDRWEAQHGGGAEGAPPTSDQVQYGAAPYGYVGGRYDRPDRASSPPHARQVRHASHPVLPHGFEGPTAYRVHVNEARRYVREAEGPPEAKLYNRSQRLSPY
ncbi:hypothetical protein HYH03_012553 [Edaphochlamys debaryana]|uniref:Uncharacterized protein n=1 Tax=Edaphochlamys debaryana TaxID=47281 RepID=A0A835XSN0_9CHLO|nr:hypothetical protein HYH03_012553 [Edaphochlamys debaryana]|eukprot:KAG2488932.1 hypothetical protein HYH03_012553 [Edaphochlamys debaryana]